MTMDLLLLGDEILWLCILFEHNKSDIHIAVFQSYKIVDVSMDMIWSCFEGSWIDGLLTEWCV